MNRKASSLPSSLVRRFHTRDPFQIAAGLDISVRYISTKRQKGFAKIILNRKFIFLNQNMSEQMQRMTCAHELGHLLLHRDVLTQKKFLLEYELFDIQNDTEYEANVFAANLLIDEDELYELLETGADPVSAASALNINVNLLMIKFIEMRKAGSGFRIPFTPDRKFLGRIADKADSL
jgi:Zn-dependent peptidase ImmA (M78 family)